jgi:hypothetical protein
MTITCQTCARTFKNIKLFNVHVIYGHELRLCPYCGAGNRIKMTKAILEEGDHNLADSCGTVKIRLNKYRTLQMYSRSRSTYICKNCSEEETREQFDERIRIKYPHFSKGDDSCPLK